MRIVVVEDEAPIREGLSKILGKLSDSYELAGKAENGAKGLELVRNTKPDLVILDIRMPDMDGLTMLEHIREEKINCKAIVLSAYSDFDYAKRAIELGIENYLLKPIKIPELKRVLKETEASISKEQSKEHLLSLEHIFLNAITGQLEDDAQLAELLKEKYGIERNEQIATFGIGMGANYTTYREYVKMALEDIGIHNQNFKSYSMDFPKRKAFVMILYHMRSEEQVRRYFEKNIVPMLGSKISGKLILSWSVCRGLLNVRDSIVETSQILEWNLVLGKKVMLSKQKLDEMEFYPLKYPLYLEEQAKKAVDSNDLTAFKSVLRKFRDYCREKTCSVKEMKEAFTRLALNLIHVASEIGAAESQSQVQQFLKTISEAASWTDMEDKFEAFFECLTIKNAKDGEVSLLIQKALQYIQQYYNQGITLEETAEKLHVSEEYLSSQFKKETGSTFTETIRRYRIENVKELLLKSSLKLNQIADMVGYSDPKYMSKVFKEEVGMLPLEYRKKNG